MPKQPINKSTLESNSVQSDMMKAIREGDRETICRLAKTYPYLIAAATGYPFVKHGAIHQGFIGYYAVQQGKPASIHALASLLIPLDSPISHDVTPMEALLYKLQSTPPDAPQDIQHSRDMIHALLQHTSERQRIHSFDIAMYNFMTEPMPWLPRCFLDLFEQQDFQYSDQLTPALSALVDLPHMAASSTRGIGACYDFIEILASAGLDISAYASQPVTECPALYSALKTAHYPETVPWERCIALVDSVLTEQYRTANGWLAHWIAQGAPLAALETEGRIADGAQLALSTLGAQEFFSFKRWQGHEKEALTAMETLERIAQPYWKAKLKEVDRIVFLREQHRPAQEVRIAALSRPETPPLREAFT